MGLEDSCIDKGSDMKTKYFLIYVFVGVAFLAVSAWVFFTRGKNAKAINAKYKLGGILLTCMAMLSVASCGEISDPGMVTCYDVAVEERTDNLVSLTIHNQDASYKYGEISPGDVFSVNIKAPSYRQYVLRVILNDKEGTDLQREKLVLDGIADSHFEVALSEDMTYRGEAIVQVQGVAHEDPEELSEMCYYVQVIQIR